MQIQYILNRGRMPGGFTVFFECLCSSAGAAFIGANPGFASMNNSPDQADGLDGFKPCSVISHRREGEQKRATAAKKPAAKPAAKAATKPAAKAAAEKPATKTVAAKGATAPAAKKAAATKTAATKSTAAAKPAAKNTA